MRRRHARPAVGHLEHGVRPVAAHRDRHGRAGRRVDQGVLDQVAGEPVKVIGHPVHHHRAGQVERERVLGGQRGRLARGLGRHGGEVHGPARQLAAGVGAGEQQQVAHEPPHAARRAQRRVGHLALLAGELRLEQLEVRQDARERGAQLVRRVRHELALARRAWPRSPRARRSARRACPRRCARGRRPRRSRCDFGSVMSGSRVRATSRAARVSPAIGRIARLPPAGRRGRRGACRRGRRARGRAARGSRWSGCCAPASRTGRSRSAERPAAGGRRATPDAARPGTTSSREVTRRSPMSVTPPMLIGGPRFTPGSLAQTWLLRRFDDAHDRVAGGEAAQRVRVGLAQLDAAVGGLLERDAVLEVARVRAQLVVEPADDAPLGHRADHHREQAQDHEGERGAQHRHLQLHGQPGPHGSLST